MEFTSYKPGTFSWVDLAASDQNAAKDFYAEIMGWSYTDNPMGDDTFYTMAQTDGKDAAGIFTLPEEQARWGSRRTGRATSRLKALMQRLRKQRV